MKKLILLVFVFINLVNVHNCVNVPMSTSAPVYNGSHLTAAEIPQFVMISYDDALTSNNYENYKELFDNANRHNHCPIQATFFLTHENSNYQLVNDLWRRGHEIAVKTVTHTSLTDYWKKATYQTWMNEVAGMRSIVSKFADIPIDEIVGFRASYLQTGGNVTFQMLKDSGFMYDSSMPTLTHSRPKPIFPYTLDEGYKQDCQIAPCPSRELHLPGLWVVPIVDYWRQRLIIDGPPAVYQDSPCSMVDFCLPLPETAEETFQYFLENFDRHHKTNKAPFPIFLHETYLHDEERKKGYFQFIDYLNTLEDTFLVTIKEVLKWMENPVPITEYHQSKCVTTIPDTKCPEPGKLCEYRKVPTLSNSDAHLVVCTADCPLLYPWLANPYGLNVTAFK